ncbi:MAG: PorT family protein, partial [Muribaculaceae bacterium]|nr:PorT family protein [Muribaculaceae bacterium]
VRLDSARYGIPYQLKGVAGTDEMTTPFVVNDLTPRVYKFKIIGARSVSFTAKQNNREVGNAEIVINGVLEGYTPFSKVLDYGTYNVSASYNGYTSKPKKYKVNKNSKNTLLLKIPNKKTVGFNPFDVDFTDREWGIAVNYIHRFFNFKKDGKTTHYNWVGKEGGSNGVQVGITYQPYFGYGQGLSTGLYWQGTFGKTDFDNGTSVEEVTYTESALYFPLQYQFRLPLHRNFSVAVNAGAALTFGLSNKFSNKFGDTNNSYDIGYGYNSQFDTYSPDKFDYSLLIGAAIQYKSLQIEGKYSIGLKNHKVAADGFEDPNPLSYKSSFLSAGISLLF